MTALKIDKRWFQEYQNWLVQEEQRTIDGRPPQELEAMARELEALDLTEEQRANQKARKGCREYFTPIIAEYQKGQVERLDSFIDTLDEKGIMKRRIIEPGALTREALLAIGESTDWEKVNRRVDHTAARIDKAVKPFMFPASPRAMVKKSEIATGNSPGDLKLQVYEVKRGHITATLNLLLPFEKQPTFSPNLFKAYKIALVYAYCENSLYSIMRKSDLVDRLKATHEDIKSYFQTMFGSFWTIPGSWEMGHFVDHIYDLGPYVAVKLSEEAHRYLQAREGKNLDALPKYEQYGIEDGGRKNALKNALLRYRPARYHESPLFLVKTLLSRIGLTSGELRIWSKRKLADILDTNLKAVADTWKLTSDGILYESFAALGKIPPKKAEAEEPEDAEKLKKSDFLKLKVRFVKVDTEKLFRKPPEARKPRERKPKVESPSPELFGEPRRYKRSPAAEQVEYPNLEAIMKWHWEIGLSPQNEEEKKMFEKFNAEKEKDIFEGEKAREAKLKEDLEQQRERWKAELKELEAIPEPPEPPGDIYAPDYWEKHDAHKAWEEKRSRVRLLKQFIELNERIANEEKEGK